MRLILRAITYFVLVFGVGFLLGIVRVLYVVPRVGERIAELAEAPVMLVATYAAAQFIVRRFPSQSHIAFLASGVLALVMLLTLEFTVVLGLRGLTLEQYFAERDPIAGAVYVAMLVVFALMPWLLGRRAL